MERIGITDIQPAVAQNGVVALIQGAYPGKCLLIRADCDGLPIQEETYLPFASQNGNMHACGHDAHTAMLLGAAQILYQHRDSLHGTIKLVFQPYEEGCQGAKQMIEEGVLENPHVDAALGLHTGSLLEEYQGGDIVWNNKPIMSGAIAFTATFHGCGTHVSTPHEGVDPVFMACSAVVQMQALISRETEPGTTVIAAVTKIHAGIRNNIVPEECVLEGSIRATSNEALEHYFQRMKEVFECTAQGLRGTADVRKDYTVPVVQNEPQMAARFAVCAEKIVGTEHVKKCERTISGGDDFSFYELHVPGIYFFHCSRFAEQEKNYPHHHPKFSIDEQHLWKGVGVIAQYAMHWQDNE